MATDKSLQMIEVLPVERQMVSDALQTHIAVKKRRQNGETNDGIRKLLGDEISALVVLSTKFSL